jgi:hypothetical protein
MAPEAAGQLWQTAWSWPRVITSAKSWSRVGPASARGPPSDRTARCVLRSFVEPAIEIRCIGRRGRCRRLLASLHLSEAGPHRLRISYHVGYSVPRHLAATVMLGCAQCSGNMGQREVDLRQLLKRPLQEYQRTRKTVVIPLRP